MKCLNNAKTKMPEQINKMRKYIYSSLIMSVLLSGCIESNQEKNDMNTHKQKKIPLELIHSDLSEIPKTKDITNVNIRAAKKNSKSFEATSDDVAKISQLLVKTNFQNPMPCMSEPFSPDFLMFVTIACNKKIVYYLETQYCSRNINEDDVAALKKILEKYK